MMTLRGKTIDGCVYSPRRADWLMAIFVKKVRVTSVPVNWLKKCGGG